MLGDLVADGAEQVRVVSTVPHPGLGAPWDGWCRYEAAVNDLLGDIPLWGLCVYDRRITPAAVLADVERTHPHLATAAGRHLPNDRYQDPPSFLRNMPHRRIDPLEAEPPAVELVNPTPPPAATPCRTPPRHTRLSPDEVERLVTATSEAVTNAITTGDHRSRCGCGRHQSGWSSPSPTGAQGPQDPYAGLVPRPGSPHGERRLRPVALHQLTAVTYTRDPDGFTVHLPAGDVLPLHHGTAGSPTAAQLLTLLSLYGP